MTKLEWALAHTERLDEESTKFVVKHGRVLDESYIRDNHCPHNYGLPDTEDCDETTCEDCWNEDVTE